MKKLLFGSDYDGTLRRAETVDIADLEALRRFRAAGHLFGVVTGRNYCDTMRNVAKALAGDIDFIICGNGAEAVLADGTMLYRHTYSGSCLSEIYELSRAFSPTGFFFDSVTSVCGDNVDSDSSPAIAAMSYADGKIGVRRVSPAQLCLYPTISQITICHRNHDDALRAGRFFADRYAGVFAVAVAHTCIDIVGADVNKAVALGVVADNFGVPHESVCAAGDGLNDIEMLTEYHGFAMADGDSAAIAAAGRTASSVGEALDRLI